jgi:hypothetical protein
MMSETKIMGLPGGGRWVLEHGSGMGGFLDPPGSPSHIYAVLEYRGSRSQDYETSLSVYSALKEIWVPAPVKAACRRVIEQAKIDTKNEDWIRRVYAYFRNSYSPDGVNRNISHSVTVAPNPDGFGYVVGVFGLDGWREDRPPAETHLAYLFVKQWDPEHEPREDLIESPPARGKEA